MTDKPETTANASAQEKTTCDSSKPLYLLSRMRGLLPPEETMIEFERYLIRSQIELLKGVRTIVDSYVSRLEHREKREKPERVSKIEIKE